MLFLAQAPPQPPPCLPHERMEEMLGSKYGETPAGAGIMEGGGAVFILYASQDGASWTLVIRQGPVACIAATGVEWSAFEHKPPKPPEKSL